MSFRCDSSGSGSSTAPLLPGSGPAGPISAGDALKATEQHASVTRLRGIEPTACTQLPAPALAAWTARRNRTVVAACGPRATADVEIIQAAAAGAAGAVCHIAGPPRAAACSWAALLHVQHLLPDVVAAASFLQRGMDKGAEASAGWGGASVK